MTQETSLSGEFSVADISIFPWVVTLEDLAEISLSDYPNLNNWASIIGDRSKKIDCERGAM